MVITLQNSDEFQRLYNRYGNMVYRIAFLMTGNASDAEDVLQNVFIKLISVSKPFSDDEHLKRWLIVTAKNASRDMLKSFWQRKTVGMDYAAELSYRNDFSEDTVHTLVMKLKPKYQLPLYLYYYEGYSTKEIAEILKINHSTILSQLRTARQKLKLIIEKEEKDNE